MVAADAVTFGTPTSKPTELSATESGRGKTGCGVGPKTRPLNHRFVGGTSPSARRIVGGAAMLRCGRAAIHALSCPAGSVIDVPGVAPADDPAPDVPAVGFWTAFVPTQTAAMTATHATPTAADRTRRGLTWPAP